MYCKSPDACILKTFCYIDYVFAVVIPPKPGLYSNGQFHCSHDGFCHFKHKGNISQHAGAGAPGGNFSDRTSEINIDQFRSSLFRNMCSLNHRTGEMTVKLYTYRPFCIIYIELPDTLFPVSDKAVGRYEFSVHHISSIHLAHHPE